MMCLALRCPSWLRLRPETLKTDRLEAGPTRVSGHTLSTFCGRVVTTRRARGRGVRSGGAWVMAAVTCLSVLSARAEPPPRGRFLDARTFFQTNSKYDPRIALAVDAVVVHMHGRGLRYKGLRDDIAGWQSHGYPVGRMFFADSDAANEYWKGKWDGVEHPEEVERGADGQPVLCSNVRPYMLPTPGWTKYLEEMVRVSIEAGADAILPEEPLAHVHTGYEKGFAAAWQEEYGQPWRPEKDSAEARFMTAQLKHALYARLEARLAEVTAEEALRVGRAIPFVLPVHSLYGCIAGHLTAPLGAATALPRIDGYVGQVWTGPINWTNVNYASPNRSFFSTAFALYDYFAELAIRSERQLWMLVDPVEDNPNHTWAEFETWYRHSAVAAMMFPGANRFEVMPWPDRIFLPGYQMGGETPAPERFRILVLSIVQAMQDLPAEGQWITPGGEAGTEGIGVAVSDALMSRKVEVPRMVQEPFSLLTPLVQAGVPVSTCIMERVREPQYVSRFKVIVLADALYRPPSAELNAALAAWVRRGGSLVIVGGPEPMDVPSWWKSAGYGSPLEHLLAELGSAAGTVNSEEPVGRGCVLRLAIAAGELGKPEAARTHYLPVIEKALQRAGVSGKLRQPGGFCLKRGPFVVAHAATQPLELAGRFVDVLDPAMPVVDRIALQPGESGLYRDVAAGLEGRGRGRGRARVLHCTHRLMAERWSRNTGRLVVRGPAETPAVVRIATRGAGDLQITAKDSEGGAVRVESTKEGATTLLKFPNDPRGVTVEIAYE